MKQLLGSTMVAVSLVAFVVLSWRGRLGTETAISSESGTSGNATWTATVSDLEVNWQLVLPLIVIAGVGAVLLLWRRRRSPAGR
jgi:hypothetical protein